VRALEPAPAAADTQIVGRLRNEEGFGLVELLIALTVMNVGLLAIVASFTSGTVALSRASHVATAAALADAQMETYRAMTYDDIGLDTSTFASLDSTFKNDAACWDSGTATDCTQSGSPASLKLIGPGGASPHTCAEIDAWYPQTLPCLPYRAVTQSSTPASPDGHSYRIDTYLAQLPADPPQRATKKVTIVVRDGTTLHVYVRQESVFDCSTGTAPGSPAC
jgi:Tfp pilus assembly protein PilV